MVTTQIYCRRVEGRTSKRAHERDFSCRRHHQRTMRAVELFRDVAALLQRQRKGDVITRI